MPVCFRLCNLFYSADFSDMTSPICLLRYVFSDITSDAPHFAMFSNTIFVQAEYTLFPAELLSGWN